MYRVVYSADIEEPKSAKLTQTDGQTDRRRDRWNCYS